MQISGQTVRYAVGAVLLAVGLGGCMHRQPRSVAPVPATKKTTDIAPVNFGVTTGVITVINPSYRFVVVDFGAQRPPALGASLGVYRAGQRIGSVRLTEPVRGQFITADILDGDPRASDTVR